MERCHNCKAELLYGKTEFCDHCGARLTSREDSESEQEKLEVETIDSSEPASRPANFKKVVDSDLELETDAEFMNHMSEESQPIPGLAAKAEAAKPEPEKSDKSSPKRLNAEQVKSVEKNLYGSAKYLNDKDKENLIKSVAKAVPAAPKPDSHLEREPAYTATDENTDLPRPVMTKRGRGLAHFSGKFIRVVGEMELRDQDELIIRDRAFLLRRKMILPNSVIGGGLGLAALVVLLIGLQFTGDGSGVGQVVGLVLDGNNQPYVYGATVQFPDLHRTVTANGQGFFQADGVPTGSHKLEYVVNGQVVGVDFATVTSGEMTTLTLGPTVEESGVYSEQPQVETPVYAQVEPVNPAPANRMNANSAFVAPVRKSEDNTNRGQASVALQANVEGAKLEINGSVVGAGNLIYSRLKPGEAKYTVTADGYETATGIVRLRANEVTTLDVSLSPKNATVAAIPVEPQNGLSPAQDQLTNGNYRDAIDQFTKVIQIEPGDANAYVGRAQAHLGLGDKSNAAEDLVRAAEINRVGGNVSQAISLFNDAIKANPKDPNAYLGRAESYLARGEEIAAIPDYETAVRLDKRNFRAYMGLGEARYSQGNYKLAIKNFKDAREIDAKNPDVCAALMLAYLGDDDLKGVRKTYEKFKEVATQEEVSRLSSDSRYSAVFRVLAEE